MSDALFAIQTARKLGPALRETPYAKPIAAQGVKMHTGPIRSQVAGRTDHLPNHVPSGSYVIPADVVSGLGEGNTEAGFKVLRRMFSGMPYAGGGVPYNGNSGPYGQRIGHAEGGSVEYRRGHKAPTEHGRPMHDIVGVWPEDFYGPNGFRYYADFGHPFDRVGYEIIRSVRNLPEKRVRVWRAIPKGLSIANTVINPGDWVTQTKKYAQYHGESNLGNDYRLLSRVVPAKELFNGGESVHEWGWHPSVSQSNKSDTQSGLRSTNETQTKARIAHAKGGEATGVPCVLAGGEHVLAPHEVAFAGGGDVEAGHRALDEFVKQYRAKTVKTLKSLPGPRRD